MLAIWQLKSCLLRFICSARRRACRRRRSSRWQPNAQLTAIGWAPVWVCIQNCSHLPHSRRPVSNTAHTGTSESLYFLLSSSAAERSLGQHAGLHRCISSRTVVSFQGALRSADSLVRFITNGSSNDACLLCNNQVMLCRAVECLQK